MFWGLIIGGLLVAGLAAWGWSHYRAQTESALDKAGTVIDKAVNEAEDKLQK